MILRYVNYTIKISIVLFVVLNISSCLTYKDLVNFQDGSALKEGKIDSITNFTPLKIQPDDVIMVNVSSYNSAEASKFNLLEGRFQSRAAGGSNVSEPFGYRVDSDGFISMPGLQKVYAKDYTIEQLRDSIYNKIINLGYLQDLSVQVQFLSFRITILGEVSRPGTYTISNTKLSILEAVGLAGDLGLNSNRDNLLVIREKDGKRSYGRVDFKTKAVFNSPYYYLQSNDIVYVEPAKNKIYSTQDPISRYVGPIAGLLSLILVIISLF
jgi:polysaccharide biosynthesis/export protein